MLQNFRKKSSEDKILESIQKCTEAVNNGMIEQTAYIRAAAEKKDMDLSKYKDDIRRELNSPAPSQSGLHCSIYSLNQYFTVNQLKQATFPLIHKVGNVAIFVLLIFKNMFDRKFNVFYHNLTHHGKCNLS